MASIYGSLPIASRIKCPAGSFEQWDGKRYGAHSGLTNKDLEHKIEVIKQSIALNQVDANDPIDVLSKVGGLDIAGMVGCYIGGAAPFPVTFSTL